jgi:glutamine synthetase
MPTTTETPTDTAATRDWMQKLLDPGDLVTVQVAAVDLYGRLKGKAYGADFFRDYLAAGQRHAEMCDYVFATDRQMRPVTGFDLGSWAAGFGDLRLRILHETARRTPWRPGSAIVLAEPIDSTGSPLAIAPTVLLDHQLAKLMHAQGLTVKASWETEFTVYYGSVEEAAINGFHNLLPASRDNLDYALDHPRELAHFMHDLALKLSAADFPVEAIKTEAAPGQVEVTFDYGDPVQACWRHLLLKQAARVVADQHDLIPTFMAAPAAGVGNGMHLHLSLYSNDQPVLTDDGADFGLSALGKRAVAGLLDALPVLAPLYAPTTNSYKRFQPHSFAPGRFNWGRDNRTCAVRVVGGHGSGLHLEIRLPGGDANPYVAMAAIVGAINHGLDRKLELCDETVGDGYLDASAPPVPTTLRQALDRFVASDLPAELLGEQVSRHYAHAAALDLDTAAATVTEAELRSGFVHA